MSRAIVELAERGMEAENSAKDRIATAYEAFVTARGARGRANTGKALIRAVFGPEAITEDQVRSAR